MYYIWSVQIKNNESFLYLITDTNQIVNICNLLSKQVDLFELSKVRYINLVGELAVPIPNIIKYIWKVTLTSLNTIFITTSNNTIDEVIKSLHNNNIKSIELLGEPVYNILTSNNSILPHTYLTTTYNVPTNGIKYKVNSGDDLQAVINIAQSGDIIEIEAEATFVGNFELPLKTGSDWIYIQSSALSSLPENTRVSLSDSKYMPKIISPNSQPAILTHFGAHNYRLSGLEISTSYNNYNLILLGWGYDNPGVDKWYHRKRASTLTELPNNITIDRCLVHSTSDTAFARTGVLGDCINLSIIDSYFANFKDSSDAQAICVWGSPGPFKIVNNFLEATGENVMFGGEHIPINGVIMSDIEFRNNYCSKRESWRGGDWSIKNLFELKNAQRVLIDNNIFEYVWAAAQTGYAIVFTVRNQYGDTPWVVVQDITFKNNIVRHVANGFNITAEDDLNISESTKRITIENNILEDVRKDYKGNARFFKLYSVNKNGEPILDLKIVNNTLLHRSPGYSIMSIESSVDTNIVANRVQFENNIVTHGDYGFSSQILTKIKNYTQKNNVIVLHADEIQYSYWVNNFTKRYLNDFKADNIDQVGFTDIENSNYKLLSSSSYHGIGANL